MAARKTGRKPARAPARKKRADGAPPGHIAALVNGLSAVRGRKKPLRLKDALGYTAKVLVPVLVLVVGVVSFVGLKATRPEVPQRPAREQVWPVKAVTASFSDFQPHMRLYGQSIAGRRVELRSLVAGEVIETGPGLREGGVVRKDELLLRVDPFQYEGALDEAKAKLAESRARYREIEATIENEQDALRRAKEQLEIAKRDLERALSLVERGTVSQQTADDRRLTVSQREQSVELRTNNLAVQQARADQQRAIIAQLDWRVRRATRNIEDTELKAPFDAYITSVSAEVGRIVSANDQVATLLDANWVDVRFSLSDRQYGRIVTNGDGLKGRVVQVLWHVGDAPVSYPARIERVAAEIAAETGGVKIYARLEDPNNPVSIRAGAFVEVRVPDRAYKNVARLPQTALYGGERVYVIENGRLAGRKVDLVGAAGEQILVRGSIAEGDRVVTTRLSNASDGLRVEER